MQEYEDPQEYLETYIDHAVEECVDRLDRSGLEPNETLIKAMAAQVANEARQSYIEHAIATRNHNLNVIFRDHAARTKEAKREAISFRLQICFPIILLFGFMAWYSFSHPGPEGIIMGVLYSLGALAFIVMLIAVGRM